MRWIFLSLLVLNGAYLGWNLVVLPGQPVDIASPAKAKWGGSRDISLLKEKGLSAGEDFAAVVGNPIVRAGEAPAARETCASIGPFPDLFVGWQMVDHLASLDIRAEVKAVDQATGKSDYRVFMPPLASLQESFRKLRELKSRNIDSYVITEGEQALAISLGVFSTEDNALRAKQKLEKEGYEVTLAEIPRFHREYWIFPVARKEFHLDDRLWEKLVGKQGGMERHSLRCE